MSFVAGYIQRIFLSRMQIAIDRILDDIKMQGLIVDKTINARLITHMNVRNSRYHIQLTNIDDEDSWPSSIPLSALPTHIQITFSQFKDKLKEQWKKAGLCPECGDVGEWKAMALFCKNGHGHFAG